ncbi:hypothetical protein JCM21714_2458 [Gracilibacillus boraciitolerans JCM 21714]|uniref:DUF4367 domain-containing protein n=1 Tax=Gracilibacillus boraciitolerans JCM 21714 TaxID=1298598 RepID=W4VKS7_9BACI|nr:hypothetical protein [Gracilibacillus boraciitolerans]GAE93379.1 hypothetical protein JCM21714_2458 [Gracilibacillus boraciitolerans JCM 21714]
MCFYQQVITAILLMFILVGCNTQSSVPDGYYSFDKNRIENAIDMLDFNPELPMFIPVAADILVTDQFYIEEYGEEAFDITFFTTDNDIFTIQLINGVIKQQKESENQVHITEDVEGTYQDQFYSQSLRWEKRGITYQLIYRPSEKKLTKEELVQVAKSFVSA